MSDFSVVQLHWKPASDACGDVLVKDWMLLLHSRWSCSDSLLLHSLAMFFFKWFCCHCCYGCLDSTCVQYTHRGTQLHADASPGTHVSLATLPVYIHTPAGLASPHLLCWGPCEWLQACLLGCTLASGFLSTFWSSLQTALYEHASLLLSFSWVTQLCVFGEKMS